jgi:small subunit ribosomal protein S16
MTVKVRMTRAGSRNSPFFRIVVADERAPRDGRFIEQVGTYDPRPEKEKVSLKLERIQHWISKGAKPTQTVSELIRRHGSDS